MATPFGTTPEDVDIDRTAPVVSRHEVLIDAPLQTVWELHTDVAGWPSWQTGVDGTQPEGPLAPGAVFRWQTAGLDITSKVVQVDPLRRTVWGGPAHGITGIHVWSFSDTGAGVRVTTEESWAGDVVSASPETLQAALDDSLRSWLADLKRTAESRAGAHTYRS